jgi:uncharacterized membrane protein
MHVRILTAVNDALDDATKGLDAGARRTTSGGPLSGAKGVAAGAGAVALAPLALKGISKLVKLPGLGDLEDVVKQPGRAVKGATSKFGGGVGGTIGDKLGEKLGNAGGSGGFLRDSVKSALRSAGDEDDDDDSEAGVPGAGNGRRMPVQQSIDVAVPIETVYNQWTQFEEWPNFMHRVERATQEDPCSVSFAVKIWGQTREFTAEITTQRPDDCLRWRVKEGITHTGAVFFRELAPGLTRIELSFDAEPGGLLEKFARGARHIKRAARADLHRFKAYVEMQEEETSGWRGVIKDGKVVRQESSDRRTRGRARSRSSSSGRSSANGSGGQRPRVGSRR